MKMIQIKNRFTGELIKAIETLSGADLRGADLRDANLSSADLRGADMSDADLSYADLSDADLCGADLSNANLLGADLRGADLRGADMSDASLSDVSGVIFAQISFAGHGERGRQLSAVKTNGQIMFFCGCFKGTEASLREYIENGEERLKESRTFALETCLKAIQFQPNF